MKDLIFDLKVYFSYLICICLYRNKNFNYKNISLKYFMSIYNNTFLNERCIEIPIAMHYLNSCHHNDILEIGNVLSHYFNVEHEIIDKYEMAPNVNNVDIIDFSTSKRYRLIISISTIEHIGFNEEDYSQNNDNLRQGNSSEMIQSTITNIVSLLAPTGGSTFLFTVPLGFNPYLDQLIKENRLNLTNQYFFKKCSGLLCWEQASLPDLSFTYSKTSNYWHANEMFIGIVNR